MKYLLSIAICLSFANAHAGADACEKAMTKIGKKVEAIVTKAANGNKACLNAINKGSGDTADAKACPKDIWDKMSNDLANSGIADQAADICMNKCTGAEMSACMKIINRDNIINNGVDGVTDQVDQISQ